MNELEDRLRAELRAESGLITPESISALSLPGHQGRRPATPRHRGPRRWPGRAAPLAAAAAVIAVIAVVTVPRAFHDRGPAAQRPWTVYYGYTIFRPATAHQPPQLTGAIVPISTATNTPGRPIHIRGVPYEFAFTPGGKTLYVGGDGAVVPVSTATNTPGTPIHVRGAGVFAITPDGKTLYMAGKDEVVPVSTATNTPGTPIHVYGSAENIEFTPDSKTAYVLPNAAPSQIVPINTGTGTAGKPIRVCRGSLPGTNHMSDVARWSAITPDGKTLYIACADTLIPISTATNTPGRPIHVSGANDIAFTPDSKTAYVGAGATVVPISTATNTPGPPIHAGIPVTEVIAITPDGKTVYVTNYEGRPVGSIVPISTATNTAGPPIHIGSAADALAITPDGKTLYAATQNTVIPISTTTNRAGKPFYIRHAPAPDGESLAIRP